MMKKSRIIFASAFVLLACELAAFYFLGPDLKVGNTYLFNIEFCPSCGAKLPT